MRMAMIWNMSSFAIWLIKAQEETFVLAVEFLVYCVGVRDLRVVYQIHECLLRYVAIVLAAGDGLETEVEILYIGQLPYVACAREKYSWSGRPEWLRAGRGTAPPRSPHQFFL